MASPPPPPSVSAPPPRSPASSAVWADSARTRTLHLSVVAPAHNEEENIPELVRQVEQALTPLSSPVPANPKATSTSPLTPLSFEFIIVDDCSTDNTRAAIAAQQAGRPWLRCIAMTPPGRSSTGRGNGQSAAFHAGFRAARGELIAVLDADLQNDPADIAAMLERLHRDDADMVQGDRSHNRKDNAVRRIGSVVGRTFRRWLLADTIRDTGCSLRLMKREVALALPLEFAGMHRFIPATARHLGYTVVEMPVNHRPRAAGTTKYGMGILQRALPGLIDCFAVRYMRTRRRSIANVEIVQDSRPAESTMESQMDNQMEEGP